MSRAPLLAPLLAPLCLLAGCAAPTLTPLLHPELEPVQRRAVRMAEEGWSLPLRVEVLAAGDPGPGGLELARAQIEAFEEAYRRSPFDAFALEVRLDPERERGRARLDAHTSRLVVEVSPSGAPLSADALLEAWAEGYDWEREGRWFEGAQARLIEGALVRDLGKLAELEQELGRELRSLELLAGSLRARAARQGEAVLLTPSESRQARHTWFRATFALYRVLNTLARWRPLAEGTQLPGLTPPAHELVLHARWTFTAHLGWLLETVVGGRSLGRLWRRDFWHRNPLYVLLDSEAPLLLPDGERIAPIPKGSVGALLELRLDDDLFDWFEELDERPAPSGSPSAKLAPGVALLRTRLPALRELAEERGLSGFRAWKELWDARLKNSASFPLYHAIAGVSRFLGHTRVTGRPPAIQDAQLARVASLLRPGDVLLAREDGFLSNAFLPGFWPHAILYLGPEGEWTQLRLADGTPLGEDPVVQRALPAFRAKTEDGHPARVIEAVSAGVVFSSLEHALQKDYALALRPLLSEAQRAAAIRRALALQGLPYDFDFDFASDDKVVCTELVYRAYNGDLQFRCGIDAAEKSPQRAIPGVIEVLGRQTMPANDLARYAIYMQDHPQPQPPYPGRLLELICLLDREGDQAVLHEGPAALVTLRESVER